MNEDLDRLAKWLNFKKLNLMLKKRKTCRKAETQKQHPKRNMKYLGVTIDQKLAFKDHLALVTKKMSNKLKS
jgi:hypothetical protein